MHYYLFNEYRFLYIKFVILTQQLNFALYFIQKIYRYIYNVSYINKTIQ